VNLTDCSALRLNQTLHTLKLDGEFVIVSW